MAYLSTAVACIVVLFLSVKTSYSYKQKLHIGNARQLTPFSLLSQSPTSFFTAPSVTPKAEAHVIDPKIISQVNLLVDIWKGISFPDYTGDDDILFRLEDYSLSRKDVKGFLNHFQSCKDCAADNAYLMATQDNGNKDTLKLSNIQFNILSESEDEYSSLDNVNEDYAYDDYSDDAGSDVELKPIFPIETDDAIILKDTKEWVNKVIADFGICPFTINSNKAGIPVGSVRYTVSRTVSPDEAFLRYWEEVQALLACPEKEMSTILLIFPELQLFGNYELFESYCESLSDGLCSSSLCLENEIQLVFFHPKYQFRDGQARTSSEMGSANFARRGPWPMINILRTNQVRAAQKGIPTGIVYKQNEERLTEVGTSVLETMLYDRNWEGLPAHSAHAKALRLNAENKGTSTTTPVSDADVVVPTIIDMTDIPKECPMHSSNTVKTAIVTDVTAINANAATGTKSKKKKRKKSLTPDSSISSSTNVKTYDDYMKIADDVEHWLKELNNM